VLSKNVVGYTNNYTRKNDTRNEEILREKRKKIHDKTTSLKFLSENEGIFLKH